MNTLRGDGELIFSNGKSLSGQYSLRTGRRGLHKIIFRPHEQDYSFFNLDVVGFKEENAKFTIRDIAASQVRLDGDQMIFHCDCILETE